MQEPERGVNPEPEGGWSWALSDYEIAYVRKFSVRPARPGWAGTERDETRLDAEAEALKPAKPTSGPRTFSRVLVLAVASVMVAGGLAVGALGVVNAIEAADKSAKAVEIEGQIE